MTNRRSYGTALPAMTGAICFICMAMAASTCPAQITPPQRPPNEKSLWNIWQLHSANADDHEAVIAQCRKFEEESPGDPMLMVSRGIEAWHLLKMGKKDDASIVLDAMITARGSDALNKASSSIGRAWLSRLDMLQVRKSLQKIYAGDIAYPTSLDKIKSLPPEQQAPLVDRWNNPWVYRLVEPRRLKGFHGQKYELGCVLLPKNADLTAALEYPYAGRINLKPEKIAMGTAGNETLQFTAEEDGKKVIHLSVGGRLGNICFAYSGTRIIVLSDEDHWKVMPKPRK